MGEEVAIRQAGQVGAMPDAREITALYKLGKALAASGMFKDARQEFQAMTKLVLGRDLGLSATAAMTGIYIFDDKVELSSNLQAQMVRTWLGLGGERYDYSVDTHDSDRCVVSIYLVPPGVAWGDREHYQKLGEGEFTMDDAKRANLAGKAVWKNYPKNMLFARAISNAIAFHCPEVTGGVRLYAPGEVSGSEDPGARAVEGVGNFEARTETLERQDASEAGDEKITDAEVVDDDVRVPPEMAAEEAINGDSLATALTPEQQAEKERLDAEYGADAPWATGETGEIVDPPTEPPSAPEPPPAPEQPETLTREQIEELQALVHQGLTEIGDNPKVIEARLRGAGNNPTALRNLLKFINNKKEQMRAAQNG